MFNNDEEQTLCWNGKVLKGDFAYIPKGAKYQFKTKIVKKGNEIEGDDHCVFMIIQN